MRKVKLTIAYDGTDFAGFQRQPHQRTVQGTLEETLSRILREEIQIYGSGRTDAGVHALGQVCHFTMKCPVPIAKLPYLLRRALPRDITVLSSEEIDDHFHAQFSACWKKYSYLIETNPIPDPFARRYRTHLPYPLDLKAMNQGAARLVGTHDFTSFCSAKTEVVDRVRTIYQCEVKEEKGCVSIEVVGNGFLYNMVRIIAGTLYEVGRGKRQAEEITGILEKKDRTYAGQTLPPEGLRLVEVGYTPWRDET